MFVELHVDSWDAAKALARSLTGYVFRGQERAEWSLEPSLEREGGNGHREGALIEEFQRRAYYALPRPPSADERLEWLAIMRHHGVPTRLIDFTYSFYVGAFFALERARVDSALWCVKLARLGSIGPPAHPARRSRSANRARAEECLRSRVAPEPGVFDVEPFNLPERMAVQRGLFLFPTHVHRPFLELLRGTLDVTQRVPRRVDPRDVDPRAPMTAPLVRLVLGPDVRVRGLRDLYEMNVSAAALFPGLDGFGRSLRTYLLPDETAEAARTVVDLVAGESEGGDGHD